MSNTLNSNDILGVANLARLAIDDAKSESYAKDIGKILSMMDILSDVNTDDVKPLTNVHDGVQVLRPDVVDLNGLAVNREQNQAIAPAVQDGLYLVPQVIE
ncbi:Asp-tRNA(Asn)/Glu-tRNA(Gln) amidotransferase subunit GatC [Moraxella nasibovis]|uniref:Asp-tRNA(Asn)/Glu-tRNA(Gln) amidotransferase subunit GatC n=1 Tax=Moraxella nasibovis TaxID=2904120 RepID=UPI0024100671|nr:Asp-tRNA(Asn)/Glu-tRNA(Gln) amidotransferase subunit GatC [Moraxella nasibovis]WFF38361.1 Asp-tRNA(Asn)/Glu-tRNA(Gln) amidotransferase subunit GatC [Moraxella nasibovis]